MVYFDESIHGLTLGSPVKLRGVPVGRVVDLGVRYDEKRNFSVVSVVCEFSKDKMTDTKGAAIDVADRGELQTLVDRACGRNSGCRVSRRDCCSWSSISWTPRTIRPTIARRS